MSVCRRSDSDCGPGTVGVQTKRQQDNQEKSREELIDSLTDCLEQLQDDSDLEQIDSLLEAIERTGPLLAPDFDVERSLADFHRKYDVSLSEFEGADPTAAKAEAEKAEAPAAQPTVPRPVKGRPRFFRPAARIAIVAASLFILMVAAQASGLMDILGAIARWTDAQFHLEWADGSQSQEPDISRSSDIQYVSLQDALAANNVLLPLAPAKLPESAELKILLVKDQEGAPVFYALYEIPDGELSISIKQADLSPFLEVEKDAEDKELYYAGGIEHHIMNDIAKQKAVWQNDIWQCKISGDISRNELIAMIDSIYK